MKKLFFVLCAISTILCSQAQEAERKVAYDNYLKYSTQAKSVKDDKKEASIQEYREGFNKIPYRYNQLANEMKKSSQECLTLLGENGQFTDLAQQEKRIADEKILLDKGELQREVIVPVVSEAINRLWKIADAYRLGEMKEKEVLVDKFYKAIIHYGNLEMGRNNAAPRFHASCFLIPTAAVNIYFSLLKQMDQVEAGKSKNPLLNDASLVLKEVALQCWTQPFRNDATDNNVVQIERFRNHVWWVGGNALAYRSLLPTAFMYKSIPMIDLLSEVCQRGISQTSQSTYNESFWIEGFTADGAGWGHGKQSLIWGYPIDGGNNALNMLVMLKGSPWEKKLTQENKETLINFFQGGNWYHYKGNELPCLDRYSSVYGRGSGTIPSLGLAKSLMKDWKTSFTDSEQKEIEQFIQEANAKTVNMSQFEAGIYNGTRWFFNNDDLMKKNPDYHIMVNMASNRCDGIESATNFADCYNFFNDDGMTFFQRNGTEYRKIYGGWDVTASPGVTAREGMEKIKPVTNWRGYNSKFNFSGSATSGGENAVAGFVFEKENASDRDDVNDKGTNKNENECIYGVQVHKAYFMQGDYLIALGAGVNNLRAELEGTIRTTIDQTAKENDVVVFENGSWQKVKSGVQSFFDKGQPVWIKQQDKFAYTVLPQYSKKAYYTCETKSADWLKMNIQNKTVKDLPASVDILRLWIDHGREVKNDTYGYVVYCGKDNPTATLPFVVLQNDTSIQAVKSLDSNLIQVVFYDGNTQLNQQGVRIVVSNPCIVQIELKGKENVISVQDPQMNKDLKQITVTFNNKSFVFELPQGKLSGKPVTQKLNF
ncbi:polysaccharide lyase family 8 super-sandwich domain-containing protein [Flavobacterium sp. KACC 22761]|uniref:polysaccharide lyase family 8 super-sandwich domain-containing protein n=1 Tax=Flavobacterium sp. KACC 22761 TaxID=3092665 RepID=UPI002A765C12|nr:polysaccharide lyase family 8 super-sandwich domain-containing protein [Flavobacterium sp. KACC 22761]WPO78227.1 polysaccharide lyase family 8 super-sandwich domain-containing protein [Flavobacterium sp. KACC 22761]